MKDYEDQGWAPFYPDPFNQQDLLVDVGGKSFVLHSLGGPNREAEDRVPILVNQHTCVSPQAGVSCDPKAPSISTLTSRMLAAAALLLSLDDEALDDLEREHLNGNQLTAAFVGPVQCTQVAVGVTYADLKSGMVLGHGASRLIPKPPIGLTDHPDNRL